MRRRFLILFLSVYYVYRIKVKREKPMKILYLVNMDPQNKTGLFNATHKRIKLNDNKVDSEKYCINFYDGIVLKLLKKLLKKKIYQKRGSILYMKI